MKISNEHGSGGYATDLLINDIFAKEFYAAGVPDSAGVPGTAGVLEDAAVLPGASRIAFTTDSFVVDPPEYRGGDIGRLSVCGTVNDLLMRGAIPKYLTCGFILKTGLEIQDLKKYVHSMAECAREAGVIIAAGDTKVVEGEGGLLINTAGIGFVPEGRDISAKNASPKDAIIVTGDLGRHHAAIMSERMNISNQIESDNAPLTEMIERLFEAGLNIHAMRDVTRGGLATILKELAVSSGNVFEIEGEKLPVMPAVEKLCGILGLDPLYMGCEGRAVIILPEEESGSALDIIRKSRYGENAAVIGFVRAPVAPSEAGMLLSETAIGTKRILGVLQGEGLPRIC